MPVTINGSGPITGLTSIASPTTLNGLTIPTTGFGKVLQVVAATAAPSVSTASTSYVSAGITASITPASTSSKVLALFSGSATANNSGGSTQLGLYRGTVSGTLLSDGGAVIYTGTTMNVTHPASFVYLDSPSTTSATTYTVAIKTSAAANTATMPSATAVLILVEVGP